MNEHADLIVPFSMNSMFQSSFGQGMNVEGKEVTLNIMPLSIFSVKPQKGLWLARIGKPWHWLAKRDKEGTTFFLPAQNYIIQRISSQKRTIPLKKLVRTQCFSVLSCSRRFSLLLGIRSRQQSINSFKNSYTFFLNSWKISHLYVVQQP